MLHSLPVCIFGGHATKFRIFLSFSPPYGGSNHSKNTFPSLYKLPTSCTYYIHFQFAFLGRVTKFRIFLSFSPPYGGSNHSKNTFPSLYQLPTSCTRYIHFWFAFLGGMPPSLEFFFLSALLMEGQTI